jgi:hypothetical protein
MTSISALNTGLAQQSPLDHLKAVLADEVTSGTVAASDESALSDAIDAIDQSLTSEAVPSGASPGDMTSKIEQLIDRQVEAGTLTEDQATELKKVFSDAAPQAQAGSAPPPPPAGGGGGGAPPADASSSESSSTSTTAADLLEEFLEALKAQQTTSSGYAANGGTTTTTSFSALVLDTAV